MQAADRVKQFRREKTIWRRIVSAALTVSSVTTLVKLVGAAKVVVIARAFGTSDALDAYLLAFLFPSFAGDVVAAASSPALIPLFLEAQKRDGAERAHRLLAGFLFATLIGCLALMVILAAFAPALVGTFATGFSPEKILLSQQMLAAMAPIVVFGGMGAVWRAALNAAGEFAAPAMTFAMTPAVIVAFVIGSGWKGGAWPLAYGTVLGAALEAALAGWLLWRRGIPPAPRWYGWDSRLGRAASQYWPVFVSSSMIGASAYVQQSIAASLGPGSVSALNYGTRLPLFALALGPAALGTAVLPSFSALAAQGREAMLHSTVWRAVRTILWVSLPLTTVAILVSAPVVRAAFQYGQFSAEDAGLVTRLQQLFLLQIPMALPAAVLARLFSTVQSARVLLAAAAVSLSANTGFGLLLARRYGIEGLALAASLAALLYLVFLISMLPRTRLSRG